MRTIRVARCCSHTPCMLVPSLGAYWCLCCPGNQAQQIIEKHQTSKDRARKETSGLSPWKTGEMERVKRTFVGRTGVKTGKQQRRCERISEYCEKEKNHWEQYWISDPTEISAITFPRVIHANLSKCLYIGPLRQFLINRVILETCKENLSTMRICYQ